MMKLEKTDPRTRELLLKKAIGDVMQDNPVDVTGVANADATLRSGKSEAPTTKIEGTKKLTTDELELQNFNKKIINKDSQALEKDTPIMEQRLLEIRNKQTEKGLNYELKSKTGEQTVQSTKDDLEAVKTREKDLNDVLADHINCINGR